MDPKFFEFLQKLVENPKSPVWTRRYSDGDWIALDLKNRVFLDSHAEYHIGAVVNNIALPTCIDIEPEEGDVVYLVSFITEEHSLRYNSTWKDLFLKGVMYHTLADAKLVSQTLHSMLK